MLVAACSESPVSTFTKDSHLSLAVSAPVAVETIDDRLAALADSVGGFGGFFVDSAGSLNIYLQDLS